MGDIISEHVVDLDSNPLQWWNNRKLVYPLITQLVKKIFSIVTTSVPSKQLLVVQGMSYHREGAAFCLKIQIN